MKVQKKRPNIVSVHLSPESKAALDQVCADRGMTIKSLLGRLIDWFNTMDKTEQSIILGQIEPTDARHLAELLMQRRRQAPERPRPTARRGRRRARR